MGYTHFDKISVSGGTIARGAKGSEIPLFASQALTASGAVTAGVQHLSLNHSTQVIAATIATAVSHEGLMTISNNSSAGTAAHTVTIALGSGTWDGTNNIATLNAPLEVLMVAFDSAGDGQIVLNSGAVALSST